MCVCIVNIYIHIYIYIHIHIYINTHTHTHTHTHVHILGRTWLPGSDTRFSCSKYRLRVMKAGTPGADDPREVAL